MLTQLLLALIVMAINRDFYTSGFKTLFHGAPNMDTWWPWGLPFPSCGAWRCSMKSPILPFMGRLSPNSINCICTTCILKRQHDPFPDHPGEDAGSHEQGPDH